jgi:hypothetical protein
MRQKVTKRESKNRDKKVLEKRMQRYRNKKETKMRGASDRVEKQKF